MSKTDSLQSYYIITRITAFGIIGDILLTSSLCSGIDWGHWSSVGVLAAAIFCLACFWPAEKTRRATVANFILIVGE